MVATGKTTVVVVTDANVVINFIHVGLLGELPRCYEARQLTAMRSETRTDGDATRGTREGMAIRKIGLHRAPV